MSKPRIAITLGDPAGIGPEIVCRAVNSLKVQRVCSPVIFGDGQSFKKYFKNCKHCEFVETSFNKEDFTLGLPSRTGGKAAYSAIEKSVEYCLKKDLAALVTAPVSKESFKSAGIKYPGHTEILASLTKSKKVAMMMACGKILSVMVTRHIPVAEISKNLKIENITQTLKLACEFLKKRGKKNPKIIVCGLNPHAGDNGISGMEEKKIIIPACKILKKNGLNISAVLPADSAWLKAKNGECDLICGMYHDQIMIPLKCMDAKKIVNVTAGLPFTRTSPGHGTAFDIAGKNKALPDAMIESVLYAASNL